MMRTGNHSRTFAVVTLAAVLSCSWISPIRALGLPLPQPGSLVVSITSPSPGSTVSGTIAVSASVTAVGLLVGGVQFKLDGGNLGAEDTTAPYSVSWNTTAAVNGSHTLTAVARDPLGLLFFNSDPVTVTVSNAPPADTTPPSVSITSPANGATVSGTIQVSATASDNVGVAGVQFFVDGAALGSEDTTSPYAVSWNTTTVANGSHSLTATARDAAGNRATSAQVSVTVSNAPPSNTTRFEESAATLTPAGAWSEIDSASAGAALSGDRAVFASASGARATFTFTGTGVSWIGLRCEICGFANVFLDGALVGTIDTYAASRPSTSEALFTRSGLTSGSHTLAIEATGTQNAASGGANVLVDAFDVVGAAPGGGTGAKRIEENDPAVSYTGTWLTQRREDLSGGSIVEASEANATASLTFSGTEASWIGFKGPWAGIAEVYVDGALKATVDTYSPTEQAQVMMYSTGSLPAGSHTIMVKATGTWSSSSASAWVVVDAFDVK
jgi:Bacterial Ig domain